MGIATTIPEQTPGMTAWVEHGQFAAMPILFFLAAASVDACALAVQSDPPAAITTCVEKPLKPGNNYLWNVPLSPACRRPCGWAARPHAPPIGVQPSGNSKSACMIAEIRRAHRKRQRSGFGIRLPYPRLAGCTSWPANQQKTAVFTRLARS